MDYLRQPLAIVDIETTGASATFGRIIEVGVLRIEEGVVARTYQTLVNPGRPIPSSIEQLTGIRNEELEDAPSFRRIAHDLVDVLDDAIFVAHNARFDYGFIKNELRRVGISFTSRCLCTVKLSRLLFPEFRHHDLTSVIKRHGIACQSRHRALGDAAAVHEFLRVLQHNLDADRLDRAIRKIMKTSTLPANLDRGTIENLPEGPGVYLFYGGTGELLYVGKSVNLRARVQGHFASDHTSSREMKMCQQVHRVEFRQTAGEFGALLLESQMIKELRPIYNQQARRIRNIVAAKKELTKEGYAAIALEEIDHIDPAGTSMIMGIFRSMKQAKEYLHRIAKEHCLCHKLLGLERPGGHCFPYHLHHCQGACMGEENPRSYNARLETAFAARMVKAWPYAGGILIEEKGEDPGEGEVFLVDQWCLVSSFTYTDFGLERHLAPSPRFDYDSYKILSRYLLDRANRKRVKLVPRPEFERLLQEVSA